jgi:(p)ppGpp synthase/HD superfamily hydrolase
MRIPHAKKKDLMLKLDNCCLKENDLIELAIEQAELCHEDHKRDDGTCYLEQHIYPLTIMFIDYCIENKIKIDPELIVVCLLHDSLEDDPAMTKDILELKFGENVSEKIIELTKKTAEEILTEEEKKENNKKYINKIANSSEEIIIIKLCDKLNNLLSLPTTTDLKKREKYLKEAENYYLPIAKSISNDFFSSRIEQIINRYKRLNK